MGPVAAMLDNAALGVYLIVFPKQPAILTSFPQGAQADGLHWPESTAQYHPDLLRSPGVQSTLWTGMVWTGKPFQAKRVHLTYY